MDTLKPFLKRIAVVLITALIVLLAVEGALRVLTDYPVHIEARHTVPDAKLFYRMNSSLDGIDKAGFRNPKVITRADIVTIGDSHTFGTNVKSEESWPMQMAARSGLTVYNLGIVGYGILQYKVLVDKALKMNPRCISRSRGTGMPLSRRLKIIFAGRENKVRRCLSLYGRGVLQTWKYLPPVEEWSPPVPGVPSICTGGIKPVEP